MRCKQRLAVIARKLRFFDSLVKSRAAS